MKDRDRDRPPKAEADRLRNDRNRFAEKTGSKINVGV